LTRADRIDAGEQIAFDTSMHDGFDDDGFDQDGGVLRGRPPQIREVS